MKKIFICFFLISGLVSETVAQNNSGRFPDVDKSPMDMSYFPANYPILKIQNKITTGPVARIIYGRPHRQNRKVFGELVEYGKLWRCGANEATEIEFYRDVKIDGKKIQKGRYTMYAIPTENKWTIILNKDTDVWGSFRYDARNDVLRTEVPVQLTSEVNESLCMMFESSSSGMNLVIAWEQVRVSLPISL